MRSESHQFGAFRHVCLFMVHVLTRQEFCESLICREGAVTFAGVVG